MELIDLLNFLSFSLIFLQPQKGYTNFHCRVFDYYCADWYGLWELSAFAAASKFFDWIQVGDVYIPCFKYQIKHHSSPQFFSCLCWWHSPVFLFEPFHFLCLTASTKDWYSLLKGFWNFQTCSKLSNLLMLTKYKSLSLPRNLNIARFQLRKIC